MQGAALNYVALFSGILIGAAGQLLLKTGAVRAGDAASQLIDGFTLMGLLAYGAAAILYIIAIRRIPLSIAYPTVSLGYGVVVIAAHYLWDEHIGWSQIIGMMLIWSGIYMLHRSY